MRRCYIIFEVSTRSFFFAFLMQYMIHVLRSWVNARINVGLLEDWLLNDTCSNILWKIIVTSGKRGSDLVFLKYAQNFLNTHTDWTLIYKKSNMGHFLHLWKLSRKAKRWEFEHFLIVLPDDVLVVHLK